MSAGGPLLGILANLYFNTGTYGSPTWSAVKLVGDLTVGGEWNSGKVVTRASRVEYEAMTTLKLACSGKLKADLTDTNYLALIAAMVAGTVINIMALDATSTTTGSQGWMYDAQVKKGNQDQTPEGVIFTEFEITPYPSGNPAQHALVTAGAPVFTAL
jgi:hypothetical protein